MTGALIRTLGHAAQRELRDAMSRAATQAPALREALAARLAETAGRWPRSLFGRLSPRQEQLARAEAMGFDTSQVYYHGTKADIRAFRPSRGGGSLFASRDPAWRPRAAYGDGVYIDTIPGRVDGFAGVYDDELSGGVIMPLFVRRGKAIPTIGTSARVRDPRDLRSIFAAFDPARAHESDLLAGIGALGVGIPLGALTLREALRERTA